MVRRRETTSASLSFLDVMSCGFGAVVLLYLIINHNSEQAEQIVNQELLASLRLLDYQVLEGEKELAELIEQVDDTRRKIAVADRRLIADKDKLDKQSDSEAEKPDDSAAKEPTVDELKYEVEAMEQDVKRLRAAEKANEGGRLLRIQGEGNRQYLTGLRIGGRHIAIAIDGSASMLDPSIVNVLRRRYQNDAAKRAAPKWARAIRTVDWLSAQLPLDAQFQLVVFNDKSASLSTPGKYEWTAVGDGQNVRTALERLRQHVPNEGTSLENLFLELRNMKPMPDNVYLITDSLPTMGADKPRSATITGEKRLELFRDARQKMPNNIPINVIMFPMEGDPFAAGAFWNLARATGGAFMAPSKDWP
jgi:hypothetical protein